MSGTSSSGSNGTVIVSGPNVIQTQDFYVKAGILHPITVGSIAVIALFGYLRLTSNRSITPITTFDWLINVALGSTLAGIVNGNSLVRGLLALSTMLAFQYITSTLSCRSNHRLAGLFSGFPLLVAFRGKMLRDIMKKHRISPDNVYASLRSHGVVSLSQVECVFIEPNGSISTFTMNALQDANVTPDVLLCVPEYAMMCQEEDKTNASRRHQDGQGHNPKHTSPATQDDSSKSAEEHC